MEAMLQKFSTEEKGNSEGGIIMTNSSLSTCAEQKIDTLIEVCFTVRVKVTMMGLLVM